MKKITVNISYAQIAVFDPALSQPFNNWSPAHTAQGFAWRDGSVSFRTLRDVMRCNIVVSDATTFSPSPNSIRSIQVPFRIPASGQVEIASIEDSAVVELPPGEVALYCEMSSADEIRFSFVRGIPAAFQLLHVDDQLSPCYPLLTTAEPA
ncbi:competence protein ComJ [Thiothrix fructosivorans]|jgi:hypothetical protein|uniref:Competence protein J (ComJ) n=1 Tax=Thiothrix fructosivorans TaxID=111770 RepID=A0A8B0SF59_9GAMM|nr:competence protein ComJ [Thiothrix fructosivorans]MBO0614558.1 hypothetical protein [Thiothrix fructosivorans]QTX09389.1 hypothetical protein J1836_012175 [Thiothrix fructosivorans]